MNLVSYNPLPASHGRDAGKSVGWLQTLANGRHLNLSCQSHQLLVWVAGGMYEREELSESSWNKIPLWGCGGYFRLAWSLWEGCTACPYWMILGFLHEQSLQGPCSNDLLRPYMCKPYTYSWGTKMGNQDPCPQVTSIPIWQVGFNMSSVMESQLRYPPSPESSPLRVHICMCVHT